MIIDKQFKKYPGLHLKKYHKKVFYKNLWNEELVECRGHVFNSNGEIVINPFTKIFNVGESKAVEYADGTDILVVNKINGFMICATYVHEVGEVVLSTTGSLESDYVEMARKWFSSPLLGYIQDRPDTTFIFEVCDPDDPHIIKEAHGLYLIGMREIGNVLPYTSNVDKESIMDFIAINFGVRRPHWYTDKYSEKFRNKVANEKSEGVVFYDAYNIRVPGLKIKSKYYLCAKALARKADIMSFDKARVDEEFYPLVDHMLSIPGVYLLDEQARLKIIEEFYSNV